MGLKASGLLCGLHPPTVCAHFSISFLFLHWTVLCLSPETRARMFALEKCCPISTYPYMPYLQPYLVLSHNNPWLLSTILGCYYEQSVVGFTAKEPTAFGTCTSASYLLGFYTIADCLPPSLGLFTSTPLNHQISLLSLGLLGMYLCIYFKSVFTWPWQM